MLKLAGITGLVLSLGFIGILKAQGLKSRIEILEEFMKMCLLLKSKINYLREPLTYIFSCDGQNGENKAFTLLCESFEEAEQRDAEISEIWHLKAEEIYRSAGLMPKDIECVKYLGTFLGQTDYENQLYQFEYLERMLKNQIDEAYDELKRKGPLYRKLGFFAGALIGIVLI